MAAKKGAGPHGPGRPRQEKRQESRKEVLEEEVSPHGCDTSPLIRRLTLDSLFSTGLCCRAQSPQ